MEYASSQSRITSFGRATENYSIGPHPSRSVTPGSVTKIDMTGDRPFQSNVDGSIVWNSITMFVNYWNRIVNFDNFSIGNFYNPTKVNVHQDMISPAELHDKCNPEELSPELKCGLLDAVLTCMPHQCGTGDRFRCDCNVYMGWVRFRTQFQIRSLKIKHYGDMNSPSNFYLNSVLLNHLRWNSSNVGLGEGPPLRAFNVFMGCRTLPEKDNTDS